MKKIISFAISLVMALGLMVSVLSGGMLSAYAGKSAEEISQQISETYQAIYARNDYNSFSGMCGMFVRCSVEQRGLTSSWELSGNGNQWYPRMVEKKSTSKGYQIETFAGTDCLDDLIASHGGRNLYDIVVGFSQGMSSAGKLYGHVLFIHAIINGTIYYSESFSSSRLGASEGGLIRLSVHDFKEYYLSNGCIFAGAGHFYKEEEEEEQETEPETETELESEMESEPETEEQLTNYNMLEPISIICNDGHLYSRYDNFTNSTEAKEICQEMGGHLALIDSEEENQIVTILLSDVSGKGYWIGDTENSDGIDLWTTDNAPSDAEKRKNSFILEIEPLNYTAIEGYQNHLYCLFEDSLNWFEAEEYCKMLGGHLVAINSEEENQFIQGFVQNGVKNDYWIGLYDAEKNHTFKWTTGEECTLEGKWGDNQPDCYEDAEFYCEMYKDSGCWNDRIGYANGNIGFICEIDQPATGDINHDGELNKNDIILLQKYLMNSCSFTLEQFYTADMNGDGNVNIFDSLIIKKMLMAKNSGEQ